VLSLQLSKLIVNLASLATLNDNQRGYSSSASPAHLIVETACVALPLFGQIPVVIIVLCLSRFRLLGQMIVTSVAVSHLERRNTNTLTLADQAAVDGAAADRASHVSTPLDPPSIDRALAGCHFALREVPGPSGILAA
jgi:hypothetical protein